GPAGLPVLDAGPADAGQVERSAIGFLVNHRAELDRQATILESRLEGVALAVHAPPGVPDAAASVAAWHHRRRSAAARIPLPLPVPPGQRPSGRDDPSDG